MNGIPINVDSAKRSDFIDYMKGITIFLVVWGHCIQYLSHNQFDFFLNPVFIFIYTFHMPLFMFISGYLFMYSINNGKFRDIIIRKCQQLILPVISWNLAVFLLLQVIEYQQVNIYQLAIIGKSILTSFWFLWAVFFCSITILICNLYFKDRIIAYGSLFIILLFLPDKWHIDMFKFMYPYFTIGYLYNQNKSELRELINNKYLNYLCILSFVILYMFWEKSFYIYTSKMSLYVPDLMNKIIIINYRYFIGFVGILSIFYIIKKTMKLITNTQYIMYIGRYSFGIYIIQTYIVDKIDYMLIEKLKVIPPLNMFQYNFIFTPIVAFLIIIVCIIFCKLLEKNFYANLFLLGGRSVSIKHPKTFGSCS